MEVARKIRVFAQTGLRPFLFIFWFSVRFVVQLNTNNFGVSCCSLSKRLGIFALLAECFTRFKALGFLMSLLEVLFLYLALGLSTILDFILFSVFFKSVFHTLALKLVKSKKKQWQKTF